MSEVIDLSEEDEEEVAQTSHATNPEAQLAHIDKQLEEVEQQVENLLGRQQQLQAERAHLLRQIDTDSRAPKADWAGQFAWDVRALQILQDTFHLQIFRPQQQQVINASMQGRDVLCLMPSGGGKSLCYQLPAMLQEGCTVVISPLLSLIQDQVDHLQRGGIRVASLTSLTPKEDISEVYKTIEGDKGLRLLYVTPERILSAKRFMGKLEKLYKAGRLKRIAVDECHCCSAWGNDFRPDYKKLGILKQQFPDVPILALTATATHQVRKDIQSILRISGSEVFRSSINRPNLFYAVKWKPSTNEKVVEDMMAWVAAECQAGASGIVYCLTRKDTVAVAELINASGLATAAHYHADMDPMVRQQVHQSWSSGGVQIMVATIAFGMGINKTDVRFVIHHSLSKSIENYYQESGRAGRDGLPAKCLLYYRPADLMRQAALVVTEPGWENHLFGMVAYAQNSTHCYRSQLASHFSEEGVECGGNCQVCDPTHPTPLQREVREEAAAVVSVLAKVEASDKRLTLNQLIQAWRTSKDAQEQSLAKAGSKDDNERLIGALIQAGVLTLDFGFTAYATNAYLKRSSLGLQGGKSVFMTEGNTGSDTAKKRKQREQKSGKNSKKAAQGTTDGMNPDGEISEDVPKQSVAKKSKKKPLSMSGSVGEGE